MNNNEAAKELHDIRQMMERSSRFKTINGWGVTAVGIIALATAFISNTLFSKGTLTLFGNTYRLWEHKTQIAVGGSLLLVVVCGLIVFLSSLWTARKRGMGFSIDKTMRRLLFNFSTPLLAGGILCLALVLQGHYGLTSSIMLIFYGMALINGHHFSQSALGVLGYAELALGLVDCFTSSHALVFWAIGFGVLHIVLGIYLIIKDCKA